MLSNETIAKYEGAGFKRWNKGNIDRLYINTTMLGLEVSYYKTGNVASAKWQGDSVSNADGRRLLYSKVWVDVKTGKLGIKTSFDAYDSMSVEEAAKAFIAAIDHEEA